MNTFLKFDRSEYDELFSVRSVPWDKLSNKTILVTGATGLIGSALIDILLYAEKKMCLNTNIIALVRNMDKAEKCFSEQLKDNAPIDFIVGTVEKLPAIEKNVDYIVHGASQTSSKAFVEKPAETILTALNGTVNLLELARLKKTEGFVYLSSMEVYGTQRKGTKITENTSCMLSPLNLRSSYPVSKQQCEALCCAYCAEYGVPAKIIRLTQTFGPGVQMDDGRVFAEFARCIKNHRDIVLKTKGETERSYLYIADAVTAILTVLLKGKNGTAYNAADEKTYCSISEMAEEVAKYGNVNVRYEIADIAQNGYLDTIYMDLDTSGLLQLGWEPIGKGLVWMYEKMLDSSEFSKAQQEDSNE